MLNYVVRYDFNINNLIFSTGDIMENKQSYGLFTTITMIVGIVIGSGIYFRADDIFIYANGNLALGLMVLALVHLVLFLAH